MRIAYPLLWSTLGRQACREQSVNTVAALARRGHEVTLLMPRGRDDPALTAGDLRAYFGVEGEFGLIQRPSRWGSDGLASSLLWIGQTFADPALRAADLVLSRIPAMLGAGHLSPVPFATDHYRPWPDDLPASRLFIRRTARHRHCLGLVLHSDYAAQAYRRLGVPAERILVAHNGADLERMGDPLDKATARARLGLPQDRPIAVYAGRIGSDKGLDRILDLADLQPDTLFLLVGSEGDGPIERLAAGRANVRILPWAEPAALPAWLHAADVLLIPPSRAPLERFRNCVLPMKLFTYLAAGRPILAPASPDTTELLKQGETALLVPPDEPPTAAAALQRLLGEPDLADRLGAAARKLSAGLTWDSRAARISAFLQERLAVQRSAYKRTVMPVSSAISGAVQAPTIAGK